MCGTVRASGSIKKVHQISTTKADYQSQAQMMRRASEIFDKKEKERAKQQKQKQPQQKVGHKIDVIHQPNDINMVEKSFIERIGQFFNLIRSKAPSIVIN